MISLMESWWKKKGNLYKLVANLDSHTYKKNTQISF